MYCYWQLQMLARPYKSSLTPSTCPLPASLPTNDQWTGYPGKIAKFSGSCCCHPAHSYLPCTCPVICHVWTRLTHVGPTIPRSNALFGPRPSHHPVPYQSAADDQTAPVVTAPQAVTAADAVVEPPQLQPPGSQPT